MKMMNRKAGYIRSIERALNDEEKTKLEKRLDVPHIMLSETNRERAREDHFDA